MQSMQRHIQRWLGRETEQKRVELLADAQTVIDILKPVIPARHYRDFDELVTANEPLVALENLCQNLFDYEIRISQAVYDRLRQLGSAFNSDCWEPLQGLIISDDQWQAYQAVDHNLHEIRALLIDRRHLLQLSPEERQRWRLSEKGWEVT